MSNIITKKIATPPGDMLAARRRSLIRAAGVIAVACAFEFSLMPLFFAL